LREPRRAAESRYALLDGAGHEGPNRRYAKAIERRDERHDLRLTRCDPEHPRPAGTDQERWVRALRRPRQDRRVADAVVRSFVGHPLLRPETFDQSDGFLHSIDADLRRVIGDTELLLIAPAPARPDAELEPTVREEVEGRRLLREHHRVAVVVVE